MSISRKLNGGGIDDGDDDDRRRDRTEKDKSEYHRPEPSRADPNRIRERDVQLVQLVIRELVVGSLSENPRIAFVVVCYSDSHAYVQRQQPDFGGVGWTIRGESGGGRRIEVTERHWPVSKLPTQSVRSMLELSPADAILISCRLLRPSPPFFCSFF